MNDRYLFRGKSLIDGKWVIGNLLQWENGDAEICVKAGDGEKNKVLVKSETVGQCTGLKDKNGKLIFEGDILKSYYDDLYPMNATFEHIVWIENAWFKKQHNGFDPLDETEILPHSEICGNVYDNPKLLEVK